MSLNSQEKATPEWSSYPDTAASGPDRSVQDNDPGKLANDRQEASRHGGHRWMMLLMCLPLVAFGLWQFAAGGGWAPLLGGLGCFAMMAVMHLGMGSSHRH